VIRRPGAVWRSIVIVIEYGKNETGKKVGMEGDGGGGGVRKVG